LGNALEVLPLRVGSSGSDIPMIRRAWEEGARVINYSRNGDSGGSYPAELCSLAAEMMNPVNPNLKSALLVRSAGNGRGYVTDTAPCEHDLVVSATDTSDELFQVRQASGSILQSNWGPHIDITAPGYMIATTYDQTTGGGYGITNGTSFSTPQVVAVAAALFAVDPELEAREVRDILLLTANRTLSTNYTGEAFSHRYGAGMLDAEAAFAEVLRLKGISFGTVNPCLSYDLNNDGFVNSVDLAQLLTRWGDEISGVTQYVSSPDLAVLLTCWGVVE
jgi:hypothetical protein